MSAARLPIPTRKPGPEVLLGAAVMIGCRCPRTTGASGGTGRPRPGRPRTVGPTVPRGTLTDAGPAVATAPAAFPVPPARRVRPARDAHREPSAPEPRWPR